MNRPRAFILSIGLAVFLLSHLSHSQSRDPHVCHNATTIYTNATFITLNPKQPKASAVAVGRQRLLAVGDEATLMQACRGKDTRVIDLKGAFVVPGFIDTYSKFLLYGWLSKNALDVSTTNALQQPDWQEIKSLDRFLNTLKQISNTNGWSIVNGYDPLHIKGELLNQPMLNNLQPTVPTLVLYASGNQALVNQAAVQKIAGFPNSKDIIIDKNGFIRDISLANLFGTLISKEEVSKAIQQAARQYSRQGYTTATEAMFNPAWIPEYEQLTSSPNFPLDVIVLPSTITEKKRMDLIYQDLLRLYVGPVLFKVDGSAQDGAAFLTTPLLQTNRPHSSNKWPDALKQSPRKLEQFLETADKENIPVALECNGDAAIDLALNLINKVQNTQSKTPLNAIIINALFVRNDQLQRLQQLKVKVSWFVPHFYYWGPAFCSFFKDWQGNYQTNPLASAQKIMTSLSAHPNSPAAPPVPLQLLALINSGKLQNGLSVNEKCLAIKPAKASLDVTEALKALTLNAALLYGLENDKGSLVPGKLADMTLLSADPLRTDIQTIRVLGTISRGTLYFNHP
ncbi:amidohydrolase [Legionella clemsonensis]|uniref:N-substituted formamide deformylase n=1 Tax=Legionella clemsonensis TaxID=1867846 RepID=A0A222NZ50_9GAMM|nr:amidohydrolase family protein [Legionella clemsonensis]ASQ44880.1 N-substituted formamide deformylase precursor [Legionella clemsonensis]